jgi:hypothetical protein
MIRITLPFHLRNLAGVDRDLALDVPPPVSTRALLDALEARYPMLKGTIRDQTTLQRRPMIRFYACNQDLSHEPDSAPLPEKVISGAEPFLIIGAISGG